MALRKLGEVATGTVVELNESGNPVKFIVVQQGSPSDDYYNFDNVSLIYRKDIQSKRAWDSNNDHNDIQKSELYAWLNDEVNGYLSLLDEKIRASLVQVRVPFRPGSGSEDTVAGGASGLLSKAFLLSIKELNIPYDWSNPQEGATLAYFVDAGNANRKATYDGSFESYWTRTPNGSGDGITVSSISSAGAHQEMSYPSELLGVRPALPLLQTLYVDENNKIIANDPPTAPSSIDVSGVVKGGSATITLTAATDPDGTVESYIYERQMDGGAWEKVAQANSLTQTDTIGEEWGTVAYRAAAVDNLGLQGPYITSNTETVNVGWVTIGGPAESMGSKAVPFDFAFSVSVSGQSSTGAITVSAALDGKQVYSGTPNAGEQVTIPIKTHLLGAGTHTVEVQASKDDYLPASKRYTFNVPAVVLPDGGVGALAQDPAGRAVYHTTLAQRCIGRDGVDIQAQMDALAARVKTLEG